MRVDLCVAVEENVLLERRVLVHAVEFCHGDDGLLALSARAGPRALNVVVGRHIDGWLRRGGGEEELRIYGGGECRICIRVSGNSSHREGCLGRLGLTGEGALSVESAVQCKLGGNRKQGLLCEEDGQRAGAGLVK